MHRNQKLICLLRMWKKGLAALLDWERFVTGQAADLKLAACHHREAGGDCTLKSSSKSAMEDRCGGPGSSHTESAFPRRLRILGGC
jgi:hypothetical protein